MTIPSIGLSSAGCLLPYNATEAGVAVELL
jgi:hypothetical protein